MNSVMVAPGARLRPPTATARHSDPLYRLPEALLPIPGESLSSLIVRNAAAVRFPDPIRILDRLRLGRISLAALSRDVPAAEARNGLAALLGVDEASLWRLASWGSGPDAASVDGRPIAPRFLNLVSRQVCPACLSESPHQRATWNVWAMTACARHRRALVRACGGCGGPIQWRGSALERCGNPACAHDLRDTRAPQSRAGLRATSGLQAMFDEGSETQLPGSGLLFGEAIEAAYDIGLMLRSERKPKRTAAFLRSDTDEVGAVLDAGWDVLADWPRGFDRALDTLRGRAGERSLRHGLSREFGPLRQWFDRVGAAEWARPIRAAFAAYVARLGTVNLKASSRARYGIDGSLAGVPIAVAARKLGMAVPTVLRIAEDAGAFLSERSGTGAPAMVDAKFVNAIRLQLASVLTKEQAAEALGIGRPALLELLELQILEEIPKAERLGSKLSLRRSDVDVLADRMRGALLGVCSSKLQPLGLAARPFGSVGGICKAVLDGDLAPRGILVDEAGIGALLFDPKEVRTALCPATREMSVGEAAEVLKVAERNLRAWIAAGLLETRLGDGLVQRGQRVTELDLERFRAAYVTVTDVGRQVGVRSFAVQERLAALGLESLVPSARTALYRRDQITDALLGRIRADRVTSAIDQGAFRTELVAALRRRFELPLQDDGQGLTDRDTDTRICIVIGQRQPFRGNVVFRLYLAAQKRLDAASHGWLVLAVAQFGSAVVVPWTEARFRLEPEWLAKQRLVLPFDDSGRVQQEWLRQYNFPVT